MAHDIDLSCRCGAVKYRVAEMTPQKLLGRGVCYCEDCQAFGHYLGAPDEMLDERGGTELFQIQPRYLDILEGKEHIAAVRMSDRGPLRWYTACCNSPLGNSVPTRLVAFTGLIVRPGQLSDEDEAAIGGERIAIFPDTAKGGPDPALKPASIAGLMLKNMIQAIGALYIGAHLKTPYFRKDGKPIAEPKVLSEAERDGLLAKVRAG